MCAKAVAGWYENLFGPDWPRIMRRRCHNPWKVWHSKRYGGFLACVWVWGEPVQVRAVGRDRRPKGEPLVFGSRAESKSAIRPFVRDLWGLFAPVAVWRG